VTRHKHYTPPTTVNVQFEIHALDAESVAKHFSEHAKEIAGEVAKYTQEPPSVPIDTSEAAALEIQTKAGSIRASVLSFIRGRGPRGATLREIAVALRLSENTARPRTWELCGNVPAGRMPRPPLIYMSDQKRDGMRVYRAVHL
jgi:hypothetical protein